VSVFLDVLQQLDPALEDGLAGVGVDVVERVRLAVEAVDLVGQADRDGAAEVRG
jgi:hypothetical protein